jgi:hypothetical protein
LQNQETANIGWTVSGGIEVGKPLADWIMAIGLGRWAMSFVIMKQNGWREMMDGAVSHFSENTADRGREVIEGI